MKTFVVVTGIVVALVAGGWWIVRHRSGPVETLKTIEVKRGELLATISATGTIEPEEVVDVGAQVAGRINFFGKDPADPTKTIDYRTQVDEGTILAQIDDSLYQADVDSAQASLAQAVASQRRSEADLEQMQAKVQQTKNDWERAQEVGPQAITKTDYDAAKANYVTAAANVAVGQAAIEQAKAAVAQAQSQLTRAKKNLEYCTIKSPVKGVIIDRRVNIGQTVVSSLNAPSLFLIAKDLKRIEVWASVNEADINSIHAGQNVMFTVDAIHDRPFHGSVGKVRLNASMTQNVVTYTVEVIADNSDGKLLPYLTANVRFELDKKENVLLVPNAALRWTPTTAQVAPDVVAEQAQYRGDIEKAQTQPSDGGAVTAPPEIREHGVVWLKDGSFVRPLRVRVGVSDGTNTEVEADELKEGRLIVVGTETPDATASSPTNPFLPQFGKKKS